MTTLSVDRLPGIVRLGVLPETTLAERQALALAIEHRRLDEEHSCLLCGSRAACAFVVSDDLGVERWWLDTCMACADAMRRRSLLGPAGC